MNLADRLAAARNQRRIEAGLPPLPGFEDAAPAAQSHCGEQSQLVVPAATPFVGLPDGDEGADAGAGGGGLSLAGDASVADVADVIDLRTRAKEPPVLDLRTDPGDGYDLTDPNAVLTWRWEARDYKVEPPPTHGSAWAAFDEARRQTKLAGQAADADELSLPNNSTWAERYQALRNQRDTRR
ncbi:MAG: hypothetical protein N2037_04515 [Acidimicrobiales bacterium]|nr:hypothetical protein [Acidimicrobiales bacterium]